MNHILIVDQPLAADAFALLLREHSAAAITIAEANELCDAPRDAPRDALLLIEVFLSAYSCGVLHAHSLQQARPDLTPIVWTTRPAPVYSWAASTYRLPGFLDKTMDTTCCLQWLDRAQHAGSAWPKDLLQKARAWEQEVAPRLRELSSCLWQLWLGLVQNKSTEALAEGFDWARRTLERRLHELYGILGISDRTGAILAAGAWQLVTEYDNTCDWIPLINALFLGRLEECDVEQEASLLYRQAS